MMKWADKVDMKLRSSATAALVNELLGGGCQVVILKPSAVGKTEMASQPFVPAPYAEGIYPFKEPSRWPAAAASDAIVSRSR